MKATAIAPANIAFIKYWGRTNDELVLPANSSISMNLSNCTTTTTVEFDPSFAEDSVSVSFYKQDKRELPGKQKERVTKQLDRIREKASVHYFAKVESVNSFPSDAGIAASASGFAALTKAAVEALKLNLNKKELTILTRLSGSGSACRSIADGYVLWEQSNQSEDSYAYSLYPPDYWKLVDLVAIVSTKEKAIKSYEGHSFAKTSPYFFTRLTQLPERLERVKEAIKNKDIVLLGEAIEEEAISMHIVAMTCKPPLFYWNGTSIEIMQAIGTWHEEGIKAYFTFDAGPNAHIICEEDTANEVEKRLRDLGIHEIIRNTPAVGARVISKHLF